MQLCAWASVSEWGRGRRRGGDEPDAVLREVGQLVFVFFQLEHDLYDTYHK